MLEKVNIPRMGLGVPSAAEVDWFHGIPFQE